MSYGDAGHDRFFFHGRVAADIRQRFVDEGVTFSVKNQSGGVATFSLPAGACAAKTPRMCKFVDHNAAKTHTGVAAFEAVTYMLNGKATTKFYFTAYGDLGFTHSTTKTEPLQFEVGFPTLVYASVTITLHRAGNGWLASSW